MRKSAVVGLVLALGLAACGLSPEEQRAADQQGCVGYGFRPGTDAFAHCMMATTQQREAQQAADRRAQAAQAAQAERDRQAQEARDATQAAQQHASTPQPTMPTIPTMPTSPMPSNMICTGSQAANAGSMSCHSP